MNLLQEAFFVTRHPLEAVATKRRQMAVALELEAPPHTSNIEEFPVLPLHQAARKIREARKGQTTVIDTSKILGGIGCKAWSKKDATALIEGTMKTPTGRHPEHNFN